MTPPDPDALSTLIVTNRERRQISHCLAVCAAMKQAADDGNDAGDGGRALMRLWARVQPDDADVEAI